MPDVLLKPLAFIVLLGVLIFVHELGHYLVAKLLRVKVVRFSIGFGPPIFSFQRGETEYRVAWLPLGGYVKMAGDDPTAEVAPEDRGRGFLEQRPWKRLLISVAGPTMNVVLPFVMAIAVIWAQNGTEVPGPVVGTVVPGSPAEQAGLRPGDRIVSVDGPDGRALIRDFPDLQRHIVPHPGQPLVLEVQRDGRSLPALTLRTGRDEHSNAIETVRRGVIGITASYPEPRVVPVAPGAAGPVEPFDLVVSLGGAPVKHGVELAHALDAAACRPVDLEVVRERPRRLPGVVLADHTREHLTQVPTCRDGKPSLRVVDPYTAAAITAVEPGGPAARAGLRRGDVVTAVNGTAVHNALELQTAVSRELGVLQPEQRTYRPGTLTLADGRTIQITAEQRTREDELSGKTVSYPTLGLRYGSSPLPGLPDLAVPMVKLQRGAAEVVASAWTGTIDQVRLLVLAVGRIFSGDISTRAMGGPIAIMRMTGQAVEGGLDVFLSWMAALSVNLAVMNLLPIPVLDGGQIVQALVETVTRRPLSIRMREVANVIGLVLILSLFVFVSWNDILNWVTKG